MEFSAVLSQRKKEIAAPSPSFPLCPSFQKLLRATQQKGTGSVALPLSSPPSSARAWPPAAAVARARRTVRDVRARAAFASAGDWGTVRSPNGQGSPPHPNGSLLESRKRIRATSRSWREGGWEETGTGLSARLRSLTACFFFPPSGLAVGGLLDEKRIWGPPWFCPFLNPQSSCGSGSRTGGRLNKALGSLRVTLLCHPHSPVPCLRGFQWIG